MEKVLRGMSEMKDNEFKMGYPELTRLSYGKDTVLEVECGDPKFLAYFVTELVEFPKLSFYRNHLAYTYKYGVKAIWYDKSMCYKFVSGKDVLAVFYLKKGE